MEKPKVIILLGPPASGKGTQAKILAKRINYKYFGTGDLLRSEVEKGSDLGKKFATAMESGGLIPDELTDPLIKAKLGELKDFGVVIDGFPRNLHQVATLKQVFPEENFLVLNIVLSADSVMERMLKRRICKKCGKIFIIEIGEEKFCDVCGGKLIQRADDNPQVLAKRIKTYGEQTKPLIDYYKNIGKLSDIDGEPPIPGVTRGIEKVI